MRLLLFILFAFPVLIEAGPAKLKFNRDIRPILSDKCFHCHGNDPKKREAKMRLDIRESALEKEAFVPGNADASEMIKRILATDDDHMPPAKAKIGDLTPAEIATLKQWINEGAEYEAHWAFNALKVPGSGFPVPGSIDAIVSAGLKERGLKLQPEATAETLVRRLSFDITGLPPSSEDVIAFNQSYRTNATGNREPGTGNIEPLIDKLLASPHYGERMAVDWLDISRYADSYGFQVDRDREVWPWRDWVVKALNENLPFDQFVTWQIAGDLLPNATDEQRLATMFSRLHMQESEGGSVEEEYRVEYVCDRVQTFATAFLGLTFECARCHDHKFDPITQRDYYGLFGMFQNIDEAGLYSFFTPSPPTPALMMTDDAQRKKLKELRAKVAALESNADTLVRSPPVDAKPVASFTFDQLDKGNKLANAIDAKQPATLKGENELVAGHAGNAIKFTGDDAVDLPLGNFHCYDPFSVSLWIKTPDVKERAVVFHRSRAWTDAASRGYELLIVDGRLQWSLIHFWPGNAISIRAKEPVTLNEWTHVVVTNDGSSKASGLKLFINGKLAAVDVIKDHLTRDIVGGGGDNIALGERFRDRGFKNGLIDDFQVFDTDVSLPSLKSLPSYAALHAARAELAKFTLDLKDMMVMEELPQPKKAHILFRGQYDQRRDEVPDAVPSWIAKMPDGAPDNRLGVAQWLTSPQHPLFARVTVNRIWQSIFGRGLVKTSEDFGSQGARPLYPELVDYLALKFMRSGWDTKALIKEIVMSQTYRQGSIADAKTMTDDPDNEWLARGPRFRLPAEMIRDNALAAAGLLKTQLGGAPVNPYEMTEAFKPFTATDTNRRSLYTTWRRTSPPPAMVTFDAPRRGVCIAKRERTDSPLQALILLNGIQYVEAARVLGEKLHVDAKGDVSKMIEAGFLRCLSRKPDAKEMAICTRLYQEQLKHYTTVPKEAEAMLKIGSAKRVAKLPLPDAAAATVLAQALLNHDECVVKR